MYPQPLWGSYDALRLPKTWTTADERYGPYGFGEDSEAYNRTKVEWQAVDWASLQNACVSRNEKHFPKSTTITPSKRIGLRSAQPLSAKISHKLFGDKLEPIGRTAIVLRTWDSYKYTQQDLWHMRSVVAEAALGSGGKYAVFLLVDVKDPPKRAKMHKGQKQYEEVIADCVPREFHNMTVLFDETLLEDWYPMVPDHGAELQMYQGLQVFANAYHFDYYWQWEMDAKLLVNTREYLDALSDFAYQEPRANAFQRATYRYLPSQYPTYKDFLHAVNNGCETTPSSCDQFIQPEILEIPQPAGSLLPPSSASAPSSNDEPFDPSLWGVDQPADLILSNTLVPVHSMTRWPYKDYIKGFSAGTATPRLQSPVSITRSSRLLLHLIHTAQMEQGLALPSEATAPSFAWWHGLKLSYPPVPFFMKHDRPVEEMEMLFNGGPVEDGGKGDALYDPISHWDVANDGNWHWGGTWPREIMDAWLNVEHVGDEGVEISLPWVLRRDDRGRIWAPALALHPVKTNQ